MHPLSENDIAGRRINGDYFDVGGVTLHILIRFKDFFDKNF